MNVNCWVQRADELEREAQKARDEVDDQPSISVADLVLYNHRLISHRGDVYEVSVKKLELTK